MLPGDNNDWALRRDKKMAKLRGGEHLAALLLSEGFSWSSGDISRIELGKMGLGQLLALSCSLSIWRGGKLRLL